MFKSRLCELLNIKYPIIQGGMAHIADANLAAAVSNAGGLGLIAAGNAPGDVVEKEIVKAKRLTDKPFGINIMLLSPYSDEVAELVCRQGIKVVTTGAGNPSKYIDKWKENGIKVLPVVSSVALAKRMQKNGADAIIAEGCEAGGHIGKLTTIAMIPQVKDAIDIPLVAAGGIADGRGIAAAFMLGAEGVQLGTRFLVAHECTVHQNYKDKIIEAKDSDVQVTGRFTGHPVNVIKNRLVWKIKQWEKQGISVEEFEQRTSGALKRAAVEGDVQQGSVMAGQIAGLVHKQQSCREIIEEMFTQAQRIIESFI